MATQVAPDILPGAQGAQPRTIPRLWQDAIAKGRARPAYLVERDGGWEPVSWAEAATAVEELANGLLAIGVRKGDAFGILGQTSLEWALFDFALAHVGAIGAAIYANSAEKDCEYILDHSESIGVLVEDEQQLAKLADYRHRNPRLAHVLTFADLDDLRARGRDFAVAHPGELAGAVADVEPRRRLHLHLHVGHDRPSEGLHDPASQLLRDDGRRRRDRRLHHGRRHDAAVPAARAQLRAADAPVWAVRRVHACAPAPTRCVPPKRSRPYGRRSSRACRACTRRCTRRCSRSSTRRPERSGRSSTGRSPSAGRPRYGVRPENRSAPASRRSTASPTASSTRR